MRDVLYRAYAPGRVFSPEVERTEIDRVISYSIDAMKSDTDEALLLNVLAPDINLDGAVGEFDPLYVRNAVALAFAQTNAFPGSIVEAARGAVENVQAFAVGKLSQIRLNRFSLTRNSGPSGEANGTGKRGDDEIASVHDVFLPRNPVCTELLTQRNTRVDSARWHGARRCGH